MDDKIEAWVQRANAIATHIAELQARVVMYNTEILHNAWKEQKAALDSHLRTTPEGYRLVPVEPTDAMEKAGFVHIYEPGRITDVAHIWSAMLTASQESGT